MRMSFFFADDVAASMLGCGWQVRVHCTAVHCPGFSIPVPSPCPNLPSSLPPSIPRFAIYLLTYLLTHSLIYSLAYLPSFPPLLLLRPGRVKRRKDSLPFSSSLFSSFFPFLSFRFLIFLLIRQAGGATRVSLVSFGIGINLDT